ncbi:MAG: replication initiator protein [Microviridae sp.]|nr:MAG: replication initiator protein [Microviridae sp.]
MPCYGPVTAFYSAEIGASGKRGLVFKRELSHSGVSLKIPCGYCIGCRLERARQWSVRCMHEKRMHEHSTFLTLTYDNEHLPRGGTLVKRDLQLFMKRLRKSKGEGVRFYACGEYGDFNGRPHYHLLLFNCLFGDRKFLKENKRGDKLFCSEEVRKLWPVGHNWLGEVTTESANYVARYILKKVTGKKADEHYAVIDAHGEVYDREPEFTVMSRRPGIGAGYYEKYGSEVRIHDSVIVNGREAKPPRYYDVFSELHDSAAFGKVKVQRRRRALLLRSDNTSRRRWVKEVCTLARLKRMERSL